MITNKNGTLFAPEDNPFVANMLAEVIENAYTVRSDLVKRLLDPRRDYNKECGYPDEYDIILDDYRRMYERNPIANRVVQIMPSESWQVPPRVFEDEDMDNTTTFEKSWADLCKSLRGEHSWFKGGEKDGNPVWEVLKRADVLCGIGSFAILVIGLDDGKPLSEPVDGFSDPPPEQTGTGTEFVNNQIPPVYNVDKKKERKVLYLSVFPEYDIDAIEFEKNKFSPRYNKPKYYQVNTSTTQESTESNYATITRSTTSFKVHWSRVVHIADNIESSEVFGVPRQRPVYNRLLDCVKIYGASGEGYWRGAFPGLSLETHPQLGGDVTIDESALQQHIWDYMNGMQRSLALNGMTAKSLSPQVVGPKEAIDVQIEAICITINVPKRKFMGSERGELSSGQDDGDWNDVLRSRRDDHVTPRIIIPFVDRLIQIGALPEPENKEEDGGYGVDWPDPEELKPQEKADIAVKRVEAMTKYIGGEVDTLMQPMDFLVREMDYDIDEADEILKNAAEHVEEKEEEDLKKKEEFAKKGLGPDGMPLPQIVDPLQQQPPKPGEPKPPQPAPGPPGDPRQQAQQQRPPKKNALPKDGGAWKEFPGGVKPSVGKKKKKVAKKVPEPSANEEEAEYSDFTDNVFCPTGKGGGVVPTCSPGDAGAALPSGSGGTAKTSSKATGMRGAALKDKKWVLDDGNQAPPHIQKAKILPGWTDVKVNMDPEAALVATGKDKKGRTQYSYSESHSAQQAAVKFKRVGELRQKRREIFSELEADAANPALRENADCLKVVMQTGIRPGSLKDTKADAQSYGATTLEGKHVKVRGNKVTLEFVAGKSKGKTKVYQIKDPKTAAMLKRRKNAAGEDGKLFDTDAPDLSKYSQKKDGGGFKTKDHRTALGTETAISEVSRMTAPTNKKEYTQRVKQVAEVVSNTLGNTPSIALKSYIDPTVFSDWKTGANL